MHFQHASICLFFCVMSTLACAENESDTASFAALQMRLLLSDKESEEEKLVATSDIETNELKACDDKMDKVHSLLEFIPSAEQAYSPEAKHALNELLQLSKGSIFDQDCNEWLHEILDHFNNVKLRHDEYKQYLYSVLASNEDKAIGVLAVSALEYSLMYGALSAKEWKLLKEALRHSTHQDIKLAIGLLSQATLNKIQNQAALKQQLDDLLALAKAGTLGMPLAIKPGYLTGLILMYVQRNFPDQYMQAYVTYHDGIEKPVRMVKHIRNYILRSGDPGRYQLLSLYLTDIYSSDVKLNKRDANKLFKMLQKLRPGALKENEAIEQSGAILAVLDTWHRIMINHESIILDVVNYSSAQVSEKDYWLNFYAQKQAKVTQHPL